MSSYGASPSLIRRSLIAHLAEQSPMGFTPIGFDVFAEIIRVYGEINNKLNATIQARWKVNTFTNSFLEPQSPISEAVAALSADTNIATLKDQAVFGEKEQARLTDLDKQITDLKAKSAEQALKDLEEAKADVTTLRDRLKTALSALAPAVKVKYQAELDDFAKKTHKAIEASTDSFKASHFKATGSDEWQAFIKACPQSRTCRGYGVPQGRRPLPFMPPPAGRAVHQLDPSLLELPGGRRPQSGGQRE